jgi:SagB-type dehydrogenase family enzyme
MSADRETFELKTKWLQRNHILKIDRGRIVLWNYENHSQYEVSLDEVARMIEISRGASGDISRHDEAIAAAGMITNTNPARQETWGWDWLSEIFHVGTNHPSTPTWGVDDELHCLDYARNYLRYCESIVDNQPDIEIIKGGKRIGLPRPELARMKEVSLWEALLSRRTCRDHFSKPVSLEAVATLLYAAFGSIERDQPEPNGLQSFGYRRTSPSAGGLQAVEPYLWASRIEGLEPGIYHYLSCRHQLELVRSELPEDQLSIYLCNQHWANDLPFVVIMTCRFDKLWWKYPHSRAYRAMLMEVGHLSQSLLLSASALGLHGWLTGYFHDRELNELLMLQWPKEHTVFVVGAGYGTGSAYTRAAKVLVNEWSRQ